jgi:hypothetical protein
MRDSKVPKQAHVSIILEAGDLLPFNQLSRAQRRSILGKNKYGKNPNTIKKLTNTHILNTRL